MSSPEPFMRRLARWCVRHRRLVLVAWLVGLVGLVALKSAAGSAYRDSFRLSGTQSFDAQQLLRDSAPAAAGDTEQLVIAVDRGTVRDPAVRARVARRLAKLARLHDVVAVASPYAPGAAGQISRDGRIAFATVRLSKEPIHITTDEAKTFVDTARSERGGGVRFEVAGQVAREANQPAVSGTGIGAIAALIVLLLVFGSALAATTPLITAGVALGVGTSVIALLSHALSIA